MRVVLLAEEPDLSRFFLPDNASQQAGAVPPIEAADARTGLAEARVVGRDREVAHDMKDMAATDGIAGDHGDHRFRQAPDLDLQVEHVEAAGALGVDVAVVASDPLIATRAEGLRPRPGKDDHADLGVVARHLERARHLGYGGRPERVADLGPVDGDLGDAVPGLIDDVAVAAGALPPGRPTRRRSLRPIFQAATPRAIASTIEIVTARPVRG